VNPGTVVIVLIGSNIACSLLGFLIGRLTRATVTMEQHMTDGDDESTELPDRRRSIRAPIVLIAFSVALIGVVTAAVGVHLIRTQDQIVGCVVGYSNAMADALERRSSVNIQASEQVDQVFAAFLAAFDDLPADGRARVRAAIAEYSETRTKAKETLKENPFPEAPRDACAELRD
jgi:hypothetical protein